MRSGWRVSRRSPARRSSSASRTSVTRRPPGAGGGGRQQGGALAAPRAASVGPGGRGRSSGAKGRVMRPLAAGGRACRPAASVAGEQQRAGLDLGAEAGLVAAGRGLGQRQRARRRRRAARRRPRSPRRCRPGPTRNRSSAPTASIASRTMSPAARCCGSGNAWRRAGAWSRAPPAPTTCRRAASASTPPTSARPRSLVQAATCPRPSCQRASSGAPSPVARISSACARGRVDDVAAQRGRGLQRHARQRRDPLGDARAAVGCSTIDAVAELGRLAREDARDAGGIARVIEAPAAAGRDHLQQRLIGAVADAHRRDGDARGRRGVDQVGDLVVGRLPVGQQDDVLLARARRQQLVDRLAQARTGCWCRRWR